MAISKTYKIRLVRDGSTCFIPVTFELNGYTYRSTIAAMGGPACVPLRRSHREAAGLEGDELLQVKLELDVETREVAPPSDLIRALKSSTGALARWRDLSYTHQREHVEAIEGAKKPETRARRIARTLAMLRG